MYKIISIKNKDGDDKIEQFNQVKLSHPFLTGDFIYLDMVKSAVKDGLNACAIFTWADDSGKCMRTSLVESINEWNNKIQITTMNSIYVFEKVKDEYEG